MMPYPSYQLYQAERSPSGTERRQAEIRLGQAAARTSELRGRSEERRVGKECLE